MFKNIFKKGRRKKQISKHEDEKVISFMRKSIKFSFAFIVIYVIWTQVALSIGIELNDVVTESVFTFFGTEVMIMCLKKMFSMFLQFKSNDEEEDNSLEDCDE